MPGPQRPAPRHQGERLPERRATTFIRPATTESGVEHNLRQQSKIARALILGGDHYGMIMQTPNIVLESGEWEQVMAWFAAGQITGEHKRRLLLSIQAPFETGSTDEEKAAIRQQYCDWLAQDRQRQGIVAKAVLGTLEQRDQGLLQPEHYHQFIDLYPEPISLEAVTNRLLVDIETYSGEQKRREYEKTLAELESVLYGKRNEYWQQMQLMEMRAKKESLAPQVG